MSEETSPKALGAAWARATRKSCPRGSELCGADSVAGECVNEGCPHEAAGTPMRMPLFMLQAARQASNAALSQCDPKEGFDRFSERLAHELAGILGPAPEPKGTAQLLTGASGFTIAVFKASEVPAGTPVYLRPML